MSGTLEGVSSISVDVRNIGGISETSVEVTRGITALVGRNATNRTSLLQAIAAALGTDFVTLKGDAERGEVTLSVGGETYTRELRRENGDIVTAGDTYLDRPGLAELYAVLVESNQLRRAVRHGGDLRELLMRPVDTEEISERVSELVQRRRETDAELDRLENLADSLADLQARRQRTSETLERLDAELEEKRETLRDAERNGTPGTDSGTQLEEKQETLREVRRELEEVRQELSIERKSVESLRENRTTLETELENVSAPDRKRLATVEERIDGLRERKRTLDSVVSELQGVIRFNEKRLDGSESTLTDVLDDVLGADRSVTSGLSPGERTMTCWTCGSEVRQERLGEMVETLRDVRADKSAQRTRLDSEIADLSEECDALETALEQRSHLESRLEDVTEKIQQRESTIERLRERRDTLTDRVDDLESEIETLQGEQQDDLLALQAEVSQLEFERDRADERLEEIDSEIREARADLETRDRLEQRREEISAELQELRTRIDRLETQAVEAFNDHMDAILDRLGYDNVDRVWIEPTEQEVVDGRQTVTEEVFDLHVVRETAEGNVYEDSVDHLSESERELVGLVVALAGYLVHGVHETVPFMLLDSLEMVDGERLVELVDYLEEFVPYLVVVLLPDHADAFDDQDAPSHHRVVDI